MVDNLNRWQENASAVSFVRRSRDHIASLLRGLPEDLGDRGGKIALKILCDGLRSMPVPMLGPMLATTVELMFGRGQGRGNTVNDAIRMLEAMQASDEAFERELQQLGMYLPEIKEQIEKLTDKLNDQQVPRLQVVDSKIDLNYPYKDNEIHLFLGNGGGGSVIVKEIYIEVERWEPESTVDYSVPAAPLKILSLEAQLSVYQVNYPLFRLNKVGERIFHERGVGAEKLIISLSSLHNARYFVRMRIPYVDMDSHESDTLYCPPQGEPAFIVPFCYAPGWNRDITPESILEREKIFQDMKVKFQRILSIFEDVHQSYSQKGDEIEVLADIGARMDRMLGREDRLFSNPPQIGYFLKSFVPPFVAMAILEKKQEVLEVILKIFCHFLDYELNEYSEIALDIEEMVKLTNNPKTEQLLKHFVEETDFSRKMELVSQILAGIKRLS